MQRLLFICFGFDADMDTYLQISKDCPSYLTNLCCIWLHAQCIIVFAVLYGKTCGMILCHKIFPYKTAGGYNCGWINRISGSRKGWSMETIHMQRTRCNVIVILKKWSFQSNPSFILCACTDSTQIRRHAPL